MVDQITKDEMSEYRDAFTLFDKMGTGKITCVEVGNLCRALGLSPLTKTVMKITGGDTDPSKQIDFESFLPMFLDIQKVKNDQTKKDYIEGFKVFDPKRTGYIDGSTVRQILGKLGEKMEADDVESVLKGLENEEGEVKYMDLINKVMDG